MKSIRFRFLIAALAVTLGAAIGKSQTADSTPPPPKHEHGHGFGMEGHMMGFFAKYLDLTDAQREQMKAVMQKEHATMKPLMQQIHQMDQQLKQYEEGTYDETKVQAVVAQQAQTLVQLNAPAAVRGRVIGLFSMSALGLRAFSGVTVGLAGSLIGIHLSLALSAAVLLAIILVMLWTIVPGR